MTRVLFRPQRGGLEESMHEVVAVSDKLALAVYLGAKVEEVTVTRASYDARILWDTHLVSVNGHGVGFTNGAL